MGCHGVFVTRTCFHDVQFYVWSFVFLEKGFVQPIIRTFRLWFIKLNDPLLAVHLRRHNVKQGISFIQSHTIRNGRIATLLKQIKICSRGLVSISCPYQIRMIFNQIMKSFDSFKGFEIVSCFLISGLKHKLWIGSNEYPQSIIKSRNKKS